MDYTNNAAHFNTKLDGLKDQLDDMCAIVNSPRRQLNALFMPPRHDHEDLLKLRNYLDAINCAKDYEAREAIVHEMRVYFSSLDRSPASFISGPEGFVHQIEKLVLLVKNPLTESFQEEIPKQKIYLEICRKDGNWAQLFTILVNTADQLANKFMFADVNEVKAYLLDAQEGYAVVELHVLPQLITEMKTPGEKSRRLLKQVSGQDFKYVYHGKTSSAVHYDAVSKQFMLIAQDVYTPPSDSFATSR